MEGLIGLMNACVSMDGNYENRKLGRTEVGTLTVSTAYTTDCGYETAIIDKNGVHPVERYDSKAEAELGHEKWCKEAETVTEVIKLGWGDWVDDEKITIER